MERLPSLSIFFPAYNDAASIPRLVSDAFEVGATVTDDLEVIVVNDGSADGTGAVLDEIATRLPLKVVHHPCNRGYGGALKSGFAHATREFVFYTDGDGQYDVRELPRLVAAMAGDVDVVNGFKISRSDAIHRIVIGRVYHHISRLIFSTPIRDVDCDFRLIRRSALKRFQLESSSGTICVELVRKLATTGAKFAEVPVHHYERQHGKSQFFTVKRLTHSALEYMKMVRKQMAA